MPPSRSLCPVEKAVRVSSHGWASSFLPSGAILSVWLNSSCDNKAQSLPPNDLHLGSCCRVGAVVVVVVVVVVVIVAVVVIVVVVVVVVVVVLIVALVALVVQ